MGVIAAELRCDAVRITGGDLDRLSIAARHAAAWQFGKAQAAAERHCWTQSVSMQNHYNLLYREEQSAWLAAA